MVDLIERVAGTSRGGATALGFRTVNLVAAYNVDSTGATDAGPAINAAIVDLALTGQSAYLPIGTYTITTALVCDLTAR